MSFAIGLSILLGLAQVEDPFATRQRFPPDDVLGAWMATNRMRAIWVDREIDLYERSGRDFDYLMKLRGEYANLQRYYRAMSYIRGETDNPVTMAGWLEAAKEELTAYEYQTGFIPFGGLP